MGVWNAHSTVGNIIGSLLAAFLSRYGWRWSFLAPGANVALVGLLVFFFLTPNPRDLGFNSSNGLEQRLEATSLVTCKVREEEYCPITNWGCWKYWVYRSLEDTKNGAICVFSVLYEGCIFHVHVLVTTLFEPGRYVFLSSSMQFIVFV
ncbi:hypothetical protein OIU77_015222 [Salix suchowensis]|uniref:Major facilitator superfamily (MFS) profile domain-containing protein n=1 Tax=Salix suchowensis TaxID=1278906 RepID=A0ABQ8ZS60_9ROSI|nr:hypothetical protein OIU77_015222 [Salix suchowensis]